MKKIRINHCFLICLFGLMCLSGCSLPLRSLDQSPAAIRQHQEEQILKKLDPKNFSQSDYVPLFLEKGSLELSLKQYDASFNSFETAKEWMARFFTKRLTKDQYEGELFEKVYALNFQMLAALSKNEFEKAAIMARQADVVLTERQENPYLKTCDPFTFGLIAYSFERYQSLEDAQVYRRKQKECLGAVKTTPASDATPDIQPEAVDVSLLGGGQAKSGSLVVLGEGFVGKKTIGQLPIPSPYGWVRATYMQYKEVFRPRVKRIRAEWEGGNQNVQRVFDLEQPVRAALEEKSGNSKVAATAKAALTIAAAAATYKKLAGRDLTNNNKETDFAALLAAQAVIFTANVFEADTRGWLSLPRVWWTLYLPPEAKTVHLTFEDASGNVVGQKTLNVSDKALVFDRLFY